MADNNKRKGKILFAIACEFPYTTDARDACEQI